MGWTSPRTWVTGEIITAAQLNTHLRDNLLATAAGVVTAAGDLVYATGANALARLAAGTASQVLVGGTVPAWGTVPTAALPTIPLTSLATIPSCRVHRTTTLALSTSLQAITFDSESGDWDTAALHDTSTNTHRLTAPVAGVYAFWCAVSASYGSGSPTDVVLAARDASGNSLARANSVSLLVNSVGEATVAGQVKLAAAGWIDFAAAFNGSGAATLAADGASTPCKAGMTWIGTG